MNAAFWEEFKLITINLVEKLLRDRGFFNLYDDGKIATVNGNYADVYINGAEEVTPGIPIREGLSLAPNDEVRILNVNFNRKDRLIDHKKVM